MTPLKYGNTNTFFIPGRKGGLLLDTDYAGTLPAFYKAIKNAGIRVTDIAYVLATHYHPDHMGLVSALMEQGVRLLLIDTQKDSVHFSDSIFQRSKLPYTPIDETAATLLSCRESRAFLAALGIDGEILSTGSHSPDSVSLMLDEGSCFVGDTEPYEDIEAYEENDALKSDWEQLLSFKPRSVYFAHRPKKEIADSYIFP